MQSVVRAFEFDHLVSTSCGACQAYCVHRSFGSAGAKPHHLYRETLANFFRQLPFHVMWHAEHGAQLKPGLNRLHHRGRAMPRHQRAKAQMVMDVSIAIEIAKMRTLRLLDEN